MNKYVTETDDIFCDFLNKKIKMTTKFCFISEIKKPIEKRCSEWEKCSNRDYCKYGKK